ncbi:hypothetical protein Lfu02_40130 [Longispora fulva]|nr:hypothetical protein Lfu02_40130 [Longispora fulva]
MVMPSSGSATRTAIWFIMPPPPWHAVKHQPALRHPAGDRPGPVAEHESATGEGTQREVDRGARADAGSGLDTRNPMDDCHRPAEVDAKRQAAARLYRAIGDPQAATMLTMPQG